MKIMETKKIKIEFELANGKYCNSCHCMYHHFSKENFRICKLLPMVESNNTLTHLDFVTMEMKNGKVLRPDACIKRFG